jgi:hypothetical protein
MKTIDIICDIVEEAHDIFNTTSIMDVIGLDKITAQDKLFKMHGHSGKENIDRFLELIDRLKSVTQ